MIWILSAILIFVVLIFLAIGIMANQMDRTIIAIHDRIARIEKLVSGVLEERLEGNSKIKNK